MRKPVLIAAGVGVLALLGGLLYMLRGESPAMPSGETAAGPAPAQPEIPSGDGARKTPMIQPSGPGNPQPVRVPTPGDEGSQGGTPLKVTRDHRGQPNNATKSPITPDTVAATRNAVTPYIKTCVEPLASASKKGAILVTVTATSQGGKVSFKDVSVKQKDIDDQALVDCVTKAYTQLVLDAPTGQGDAEYKLAMPFSVP